MAIWSSGDGNARYAGLLLVAVVSGLTHCIKSCTYRFHNITGLDPVTIITFKRGMQ